MNLYKRETTIRHDVTGVLVPYKVPSSDKSEDCIATGAFFEEGNLITALQVKVGNFQHEPHPIAPSAISKLAGPGSRAEGESEAPSGRTTGVLLNP